MLRFEVIGTIDQIHGLESDYVFVSFCRASASNLPSVPAFGGFLQDPRRFRVALTRPATHSSSSAVRGHEKVALAQLS
jgi:superfamily I DNA and/or RNA helicase